MIKQATSRAAVVCDGNDYRLKAEDMATQKVLAECR